MKLPELPTVGGSYVNAYVVFAVCLHAFEQYLELRQLRKNRETETPPEFQGVVDEATFMDAQAYQLDKRRFGFVKENVSFVVDKIIVLFVSAWLWAVCVQLFGTEAEYSCTLLWLFLQQWVGKLVSTPFSLYLQFVVEEKHGFNKMTKLSFVTDLVKSEFLTCCFGGLLASLLIWIVRSYGENFHFYAWAAVQVLIIVFMWIYPNFIQPMFDKFQPVEDAALREEIENLAVQAQFPRAKLFVIDGSRRVGHNNAYFFGFWRWKRIVLYDTLLHLNQEDILAIICHELGHWKFGHTVINLVICSLHMFVLFLLFNLMMYSEVSKLVVKQFGYGDTDAVMVELTIFMMLFSPSEQVVTLLMTMMSRRFVFQADKFAACMGRSQSLQAGLQQIHEENKRDLNPDAWYSWYRFSLPPLVERLRALRALDNAFLKKDM